ncbi:MAG: phosphoribosylanthranilate isomerase [Cyclobacteriaceae bacterium]
MREPNNISELIQLSPDYMGMIFYEKSKRFATDVVLPEMKETSLIGVFVNASIDDIERLNATYQFDYLQLHGSESIEFVKDLKQRGYSLIKVFGVQDKLPLAEMKPYEPYVEFFLFDTKTPEHGGSGRKFDWTILSGYELGKPFFLSGGIELEDIETIKSMDLPMLHAIDVNSKFELAPALKDIERIRILKELI